jgi:hypothetical protein
LLEDLGFLAIYFWNDLYRAIHFLVRHSFISPDSYKLLPDVQRTEIIY